jgi:hypothetical protein
MQPENKPAGLVRRHRLAAKEMTVGDTAAVNARLADMQNPGQLAMGETNGSGAAMQARGHFYVALENLGWEI